MGTPLIASAESSFSEYFDNDPEFLHALQTIELPGDDAFKRAATTSETNETDEKTSESEENEADDQQDSEPSPPPPSQYRPAYLKRKRSSSPEDGVDDAELPGRKGEERENGRRVEGKENVRKGEGEEKGRKGEGEENGRKGEGEENGRKGEGNEIRMAYAEDEDVYGAAHFGAFGEYMRRKRAKLQIQNEDMDRGRDGDGRSAEKSRIFRGVAIYVNGWTDPSVQELRRMIIEHGGVFQPYLDRKDLVTHIITCSLTPAKVKEFKNMKIVTPSWLVDSVAAGKLLSWHNYIFRPGYRAENAQGRAIGQTSLSGFTSQKSAPQPVVQARFPEQTGSKQARGSPPPMRMVAPTDNLDSPRKTLSKSATATTTTTPPRPIYTTDPTTPEEAARVPGYASHTSNPHAQRVMAQPEWRAAHTSVAPDFIKGFYEKSRLHHLSTWKTELKSLVAEAQERAERAAEADGSIMDGAHASDVVSTQAQMDALAHGASDGVSMRGAELVVRSPSKDKGKGKAVDKPNPAASSKETVIMHCDFDAFFVSAGLVDRPHLRGKPVVVCHSQGGQGGESSTSEIASASYEAREFGVKGGMSLQQARKLCPGIVTIPYEFEKYKEFSLRFYTILMGFADELQAVSVDEALIDVTSRVARAKANGPPQDVFNDQPPVDYAKQVAEEIRDKVRKMTDCEVSIGIAHNIMMARLATRRAKPAKSYHLLVSALPEFLSTLKLDDLPGFGRVTRDKAEEKLGSSSLSDLATKSRALLCEALGKGMGETLFKALRGIDEKKLESDKERKSVSCEINYGIRFETEGQVEKFMFQLAEEVASRLDAIERRGRALTLKIMTRRQDAPVEAPKFMGHGLCDTFSKHCALSGPDGRATSDANVIGEQAWQLLQFFSFDPKELRGIGVQIQKLESATGAIGNVNAAQPRLPFKRIDHSSKASSSRVVVEDMPPPPPPQTRHVSEPRERVPVLPPERARSASPAIDLPNYSQLDPSVLQALPADIRADLEADYKRRSESPAPGAMPPPSAIPSKKPLSSISTSNMSGSKADPTANALAALGRRVARKPLFMKGSKPPNLARITQQLAPRVSRPVSEYSPTKRSFSPVKKKKKRWTGTIVDIDPVAQRREDDASSDASRASSAEPAAGAGGRPRRARVIAGPGRSSIYDFQRIGRKNVLRRAVEASVIDPKAAVEVTEDELAKLGIDAAVFACLPPELQREQLVGARLAGRRVGVGVGGWLQTRQKQRQLTLLDAKPKGGWASVGVGPRGIAELLMKPTERTVIKAPKLKIIPIPKQPPPYAFHPPQPTLKQTQADADGTPRKVRYRHAEQVQDVLALWVRAFAETGPRAEDVAFFGKWVMECVDPARGKSTEGGLERAVRVLRWWAVLVRRTWGAWEEEDEWDYAGARAGEEVVGVYREGEGEVGVEVVAKRWWAAFREVKDGVDAVMRKRFGGTLSLD